RHAARRRLRRRRWRLRRRAPRPVPHAVPAPGRRDRAVHARRPAGHPRRRRRLLRPRAREPGLPHLGGPPARPAGPRRGGARRPGRVPRRADRRAGRPGLAGAMRRAWLALLLVPRLAAADEPAAPPPEPLPVAPVAPVVPVAP